MLLLCYFVLLSAIFFFSFFLFPKTPLHSPYRQDNSMGRILLVRKDGEETMLGIGLELNEYNGFIKVRYLESDEDVAAKKSEEETRITNYMCATLRVECIPSFWCVKVGTFQNSLIGEAFDIEMPEDTIEVAWDAIERALSRNIVTRKYPKPGTLEYVMCASSPRPSDNFDRSLFEIRPSELCGDKGHVTDTFVGLFAKVDLKEGYYVGEYLGERFEDLVGREESRYLFAVFDKPTHTEQGRPKLVSAANKGSIVQYVDASDSETSSFIRFVNAPTIDVDCLSAEDALTLRTDLSHLLLDRPGWANSTFVQIEDRIFLVTSCPIPAGKEILASYGDAFPIPADKRKIMRSAKEWLKTKSTILEANPLTASKKRKAEANEAKQTKKTKK